MLNILTWKLKAYFLYEKISDQKIKVTVWTTLYKEYFN